MDMILAFLIGLFTGGGISVFALGMCRINRCEESERKQNEKTDG